MECNYVKVGRYIIPTTYIHDVIRIRKQGHDGSPRVAITYTIGRELFLDFPSEIEAEECFDKLAEALKAT